MDCYAVLNVPRDASRSRIRRACRNLLHQHDPDRDNAADRAVFCEVTNAFDTLSDAGARADHDRQLAWRDATGTRDASRPRALSPPRDLFGEDWDYRPSREAILRAFLDSSIGHLPKS